MNNQIVSANKLGLHVETINSENTDDWEIIIERLRYNQIDALIISPERLANDKFKELLHTGDLQISLFVVDEAHCISDWGHDFRPDYRRKSTECQMSERTQKELNNNFFQYNNAKDSFEVKQIIEQNVLLIDDMVDSRWTFTVCGYKLQKCGSGKVFPFALANSAGGIGDK